MPENKYNRSPLVVLDIPARHYIVIDADRPDAVSALKVVSTINCSGAADLPEVTRRNTKPFSPMLKNKTICTVYAKDAEPKGPGIDRVFFDEARQMVKDGEAVWVRKGRGVLLTGKSYNLHDLGATMPASVIVGVALGNRGHIALMNAHREPSWASCVVMV